MHSNLPAVDLVCRPLGAEQWVQMGPAIERCEDFGVTKNPIGRMLQVPGPFH